MQVVGKKDYNVQPKKRDKKWLSLSFRLSGIDRLAG